MARSRVVWNLPCERVQPRKLSACSSGQRAEEETPGGHTNYGVPFGSIPQLAHVARFDSIWKRFIFLTTYTDLPKGSSDTLKLQRRAAPKADRAACGSISQKRAQRPKADRAACGCLISREWPCSIALSRARRTTSARAPRARPRRRRPGR
eukprot:910165-Prymnesium_polylepis.2